MSSLMPWTLNYYANRQLQELNISLGLIKYQITATEPTEFTAHCLVLPLWVSCVQDWVCLGSVFKSQYSKPFCLIYVILPVTEFVKRKGTTIFGGFCLLLDSWNPNKSNNCCIGNVSYWVNTGWVNTGCYSWCAEACKKPFRLT